MWWLPLRLEKTQWRTPKREKKWNKCWTIDCCVGKTLMFVECDISYIWLDKLLVWINWEYYSETVEYYSIQKSTIHKKYFNWRESFFKQTILRFLITKWMFLSVSLKQLVKIKENLWFNRHHEDKAMQHF